MSAEEMAISQALLEARAHALLEEWGEWQRREAPPVRRPTGNPIAVLMDNYARRVGTDKRRRWAHVRQRRVVDGGAASRTVRELPMSPDRADTQSRGGPVVSPPWPVHVQRVDAVLAQLPAAVLDVLRSYYIACHSIRQGADRLRIGRNEYDKRLERGRWYLIGRLEVVDTAVSRQEHAD